MCWSRSINGELFMRCYGQVKKLIFERSVFMPDYAQCEKVKEVDEK